MNGAPTLRTEDPLGVDGHAQRSTARPVLQKEPRDLDGILARNEYEQLRPDSAMLMLETAVPLAVTDEVRAFVPDRQRRGAPDLPGLLVANEEGFSGQVPDRIVRPRRELVLTAVAPPRVAGPGFRHEAAEGRVGQDVDPGSRSPLPFSQDRDVFGAVFGEAPQAVEELERQARRRNVFRGRPGRNGLRGPCRGSAPQEADDLLRQRPVAREQDDSRGCGERVALLAGEQLAAQDEDFAGRILRGGAGHPGPRADQRLERRAELGRVGGRLLVDDDQVHTQPLPPPVLVGAQKLAHDALVLELVDPDEHDGPIAGDPVSPESRSSFAVAPERLDRSAQRGIGVEDAGRQALEQMRLVARDAEMAQFDLSLRPGEAGDAIERIGVPVFLGQGQRALP